MLQRSMMCHSRFRPASTSQSWALAGAESRRCCTCSADSIGPTSGEVFLQGDPVSKMKSLDEVRSRLVGFVFQSFHLLPNLTVSENVQLPMFETKMTPKEREARSLELLPVVGIEHRAKHLASKLSVGERQRVAIARSAGERADRVAGRRTDGKPGFKDGRRYSATIRTPQPRT